MKPIDYLKLVVICTVSLSAGLFGWFFMGGTDTWDWYDSLAKPFFTPPGWVFGPVWTVLYILMGVAAFFVWRKGLKRKDVRIALVFFITQLVLNALWTPIFFGLHRIGFALAEICLLWADIILTMVSFFRVSRIAGILLCPYFLWVSFAAVLNAGFWWLNR